MVLVQKWPFSQLFFLGKIAHENLFYDTLERKNAFLGYEKQQVQIVEKLTFDHILELKNAFLGYKNKKLKKSKN